MVQKKSYAELQRNILASGTAGFVQPAMFNSLDCLKVRWQVQRGHDHNDLGAFVRSIVRREGFWGGLWRPGLPLNMSAVAVSQGLRMGLYPSMRDTLAGSGGKNEGLMAASGLISGAIAYFISAPLWLAKTQVQALAQANSALPAANKLPWQPPATMQGWWRGSSVLVLRGALLTCGQMLGYDSTKSIAKKHQLMEDGLALHVLAACVAGLLAATFSTPADVVVSHYQSAQIIGSNSKQSMLECAVGLARTRGGPAVFFTGWIPNVSRLSPTFVVGSVIYERARLALGLGYLDA